MDANLCALHRRVITIAQRDVWLAIQLRGREHLGGKPNVSDMGVFNTGEYILGVTLLKNDDFNLPSGTGYLMNPLNPKIGIN